MRYDTVDLGKTELVNVKVENLASAPAGPVRGQLYYDTVLGALYVHDGSAWGKIWTSTNMGDGLNAGTVSGYSLDQDLRTVGSPTFKNVNATAGSGALSLKAGASDHVYMQFYARTAALSTRSGFIGYPASGATSLTISNEIAGGNVSISPGAGGIFSIETALTAVSGTFTVGNGTAPLSVNSRTRVDLLNVDQVDGFDFDQDVRRASSPSFAGLSISGAITLGGVIRSDAAFQMMTTAGNAQRIYTGGVLASSSYTDSANIPSQGIYSKGNIRTAGQILIDLPTGTVPIVTTNQTVIPNMNVDLLDSMHADAGSSASTVAARDGSGDLSARVLKSVATQGTAPFSVTSSTVVPNLNVSFVNGNTMNQNLRTTDNVSFASVNLSGTITTGAEKYMSNAVWGLSLQNSDIVKVNGIYFNDLSDAIGEGLMFPKTGAPVASTTINDYTQLYVDGAGQLWVGSTNISAGVSGAATPDVAQAMATAAEINAKAASVPITQKGVASGVATLGTDGKLTASQIPTTLETTSGAQTKATTALTSAKAYTDTVAATKANAATTYSKTETDARIQSIIGAAPDALDTLVEISAALNNDPNFAATITTSLSTKVDKVAGKDLSTEDYTTVEKNKLAGIAANANNYVHPASHPASIITQDATNRFVSDTEKATWNAKASTAVATTVAAGLMSTTDKAKLDGVAAGANNYVHPATHPASMIVQDATNRFVSDTEKAAWNARPTISEVNTQIQAIVGAAPEALNTLKELSDALGNDPNFATTVTTGLAGKVDKVTGKGLSTEDYTTAEKTKLAGVSANANNYVHPSTHPATMIVQDSANRFVTDAEKAAWNAKPSGSTATGGANGLLSAEDKIKLDGIAVNANNYTHPATHPASIIVQDTNSRFVSDAEKATWNAKASTAVATTSAAGLLSGPDKSKLDGIATGANNYVHPASHPASIITQDANNRFVSDTEKATWNAKAAISDIDSRIQAIVGNAPAVLDTLKEIGDALGNDPNFATTMTTKLDGKVDKIAGKDLSTEDYTTAEKTKLAGIAAGANAYTHPSSHPASIITQDANNRFTTDAEKAAWNAKASTAVATTSANGLLSSADKTKLDGIAAGANNYTHPATHPASIITQDASNRFVSDAQISAWTAKQAALGYTPENVSNKGVANGYASLDASTKVPAAQLPAATTSVTGIVSLNDTNTSTSTTIAATANAAKKAFDRAVAAETAAKAASVSITGDTMTGALTAPAFKSGNYTIQYNATENSLDFIVA